MTRGFMALAAAAFLCTASAFQAPLGMFDKPALHVSGIALRVAGRPTGAPVQLFLRGGRPPSSRRKTAQDGLSLAGGEGDQVGHQDEEEVDGLADQEWEEERHETLLSQVERSPHVRSSLPVLPSNRCHLSACFRDG